MEIPYRQNIYSPLAICAWRFPESTKLLLNVFGVVHASSLAKALDHAPQDLVHATINLYTYGFTKLFEAIRENNYAPSLVSQTRGILSHDSAGYIRLIRQVIENAIVVTWARQQGHGSYSSRRPDYRGRPGATNRGHQSAHSSTVPPEILAKVTKRDNQLICLRFQTKRVVTFQAARTSTSL
ncbi:hypothetical protein JG688_00016129 [Phytophthora aleatoria]|uniref:Uncharacterized protein n=1 Tax=Phytophthora aleatoria TaxID=2496075 RepID=A0A8J5M2A9_9STRA|nr:hypothetical protein JG688_00016129 [Phytophthora aleatoria]